MTVVACLLVGLLSGCGERYSYMTYKEVILSGPTTANFNCMVATDPNKIPNLYVKTPDGDVFQFQELPEAVVRQLDGAQHADQLGVAGQYSCGETMLEYKKGKLLSFSVGEGPLKIATNPDGPFHSFPMTRDDILQILGEPEREGRASKSSFQWK